MRHYLVAILFALFSLAVVAENGGIPAAPNPPKLVNDYSELLSNSQRQKLERELVAYSDSASTQITVVILDDIGGDHPALFAAELGEQWQVGQKGFDNGVVILIKNKTKGSKGEVAIATGYGVEEKIPDAIAKRIIDRKIVPNFKKGKFYQGIDLACTEIIERLEGSFEPVPESRDGWAILIVIFLIIAVVIIIIMLSKIDGGSTDGGGSTQNTPRTGRSGWGGGWTFGSGGGSWSSGSGSSGGFGGFGGGSFGGGGASGSW